MLRIVRACGSCAGSCQRAKRRATLARQDFPCTDGRRARFVSARRGANDAHSGRGAASQAMPKRTNMTGGTTGWARQPSIPGIENPLEGQGPRG